LKLIVLGSGTTVPSRHRSAPAYYLEAADRELLVDCGDGALVQLERAQKSYKTVDAVFITHTHQDHIGDLARLIHALKATPGFEREKTLYLYGPPGFVGFFEACIDSQVQRPNNFSIDLNEAKEVFDLFGTRILTSAVVHSKRIESVAYRFEHKGKSIVFSGDCDYCPQIVTLSKSADLLVLDCSFSNEQKRPGHLTAKESGEVAKLADVKSLILTHLYPQSTAENTRLDECRAVFKGEVRLAEDLMQIEL
jgi:ribonuclease BN (tRNA processing enzyme)